MKPDEWNGWDGEWDICIYVPDKAGEAAKRSDVERRLHGLLRRRRARRRRFGANADRRRTVARHRRNGDKT